MLRSFFLVGAFLSAVLACPGHLGLWKRNTDAEYDYQFPQGWGQLSEEYELYGIGTHQTPLKLVKRDGASKYHTPSFNYPNRVDGYLANYGRSVGYILSGVENTTSLPSISFEEAEDAEEEAYLIGWHLHTPSEHVIDGEPARAEMLFVHADAEGNPRSVLGFLIQPSPNNRTQPGFFNQIDQPFPALGSEEERTMTLDPNLAIEDVGGFKKFWSYEGSLTTPPCSEGLRWFVSQQPLYVDDDTLQSILRVSTYSARPTQPRWLHRLNE